MVAVSSNVTGKRTASGILTPLLWLGAHCQKHLIARDVENCVEGTVCKGNELRKPILEEDEVVEIASEALEHMPEVMKTAGETVTAVKTMS